MPDDGRLQLGPYPTPPTEFQVSKFLQHVRETGYPEGLPNICTTPPSLDLDHRHVCQIDIPTDMRASRDMVVCTFCSNGRPKFWHGHLIWSEDGNIRLLGNCCGPRFFGAVTYRDMLAARRRQQRRIYNEDFLLDKLPLLPDLLSTVGALEKPCEAVQKTMRDFHRGVQPLASIRLITMR